jgi:hypothetical protein
VLANRQIAPSNNRPFFAGFKTCLKIMIMRSIPKKDEIVHGEKEDAVRCFNEVQRGTTRYNLERAVGA